MPSPQFIKSYFSSFTDDIISQLQQKGEKKDEDKDKEGEAAEITERSEYFIHVIHKPEDGVTFLLRNCGFQTLKKTKIKGTFPTALSSIRNVFW